MHRYFLKTPWLVKQLFPSYVWSLPPDDHAVYLTFDDGPHPSITPWVLDQLKIYDAQATFFCIGNNVTQYPEVYRRIIAEMHGVGNHTYQHLNGWHSSRKDYLDDVAKAAEVIKTNLFRPPYGRIRSGQAKQISNVLQSADARIIMWDILSADFDRTVSPVQCYANVERHVRAGSIIVFHDSEKAFENLKYALPKTLEFLTRKGYRLKKIG